MNLPRFIYAFLLLLLSIDCYKILVFSPAISKSHLLSCGRIADELKNANHDVTLLEIDYLKISNETKSSKLVKKKVVSGFKNSDNFIDILQGLSNNVLESSSIFETMYGLWHYQMATNSLCEEFIQDEQVFNELKDEQFDAFFTEHITLCGLGYAKALGIKNVFLVSSCPFISPTFDQVGLSIPTATVPIWTEFSNPPTYWERTVNFFDSLLMVAQYRAVNYGLTQIYREKFGLDFPSIDELCKDVDVVFVSTDELLDFTSQTYPNVIHIGGIGSDDHKNDMDEEMQKEMQKGEKGVILFSLGTIANTTRLPPSVMETFLDIVARNKEYHFILRVDKYDKVTQEKAKTIKNVYVSSWLPQASILSHSRLLAFITHAGYNSIIEAVKYGVPLVTIPFRFDQPLNGQAVERKGWGVRVNKYNLLGDQQPIENALHEILNNRKYRDQAKRLSQLINTRPSDARSRLIKTTEWVIKNNGVMELKADERLLSFITYHNIDIIIPFIVIPTVVLFVLVLRICKRTFGFSMRNKKVKQH